MSLTVDEMVSQVRSQLDESNTANVTDLELIDALNRGQRKAAQITARYVRDLMWTSTTITTVAGQVEYDIPDQALGRRINQVEVQISATPFDLKKIANVNKYRFDTNSAVSRPYYYTTTKNHIELYPRPAGGLTITIQYTARPEDLVKVQGRIESINTGSNYVVVDALGSDVSSVSTGFNSYVNIIDYVTGEVKATLQVSEIDTTTKQVKFKTASLTRTTVLGKTVVTAIPSTVEADDYICIIKGVCVSELPESFADYLMQSAIVDVRRRFGEPSEEEYRYYKELEDEIKKMWVGREAQNRIRKSASAWRGNYGSSLRRLLS